MRRSQAWNVLEELGEKVLPRDGVRWLASTPKVMPHGQTSMLDHPHEATTAGTEVRVNALRLEDGSRLTDVMDAAEEDADASRKTLVPTQRPRNCLPQALGKPLVPEMRDDRGRVGHVNVERKPPLANPVVRLPPDCPSLSREALGFLCQRHLAHPFGTRGCDAALYTPV